MITSRIVIYAGNGAQKNENHYIFEPLGQTIVTIEPQSPSVMWRIPCARSKNRQPTPPPLPPQPETRDMIDPVRVLLDQNPIAAMIARPDEPVYGRVDLPHGHCVCCAKPCQKADFFVHRQKAICDECTEYGCGIDLVYCESHTTFQRHISDAIEAKVDEMSELFESLRKIPEIEQIRGVVAMRKSPIDRHIIGKALMDMLGI